MPERRSTPVQRDAREKIGGEVRFRRLKTFRARLLMLGGDVYRTVTLPYRGGPRYPHLESRRRRADLLGAIAKPLAADK